MVVRYECMAKSLYLLSPALPASTRSATRLLTAALCLSALTLTGCNKPAPVETPVAVAPSPTVPTAAPFVPPSAARLYEMVAPIALYPDKLVAQVLAGATYPQQITQADQWLTTNAALKAGPLADAAQLQSWDPSVKSLTAFKRVLDQMANNLPWTTALGQTYYNDPEDVLNAIQVMRQRASQAGQLKSNPKLRVAAAAAAVQPAYTPAGNSSSGYRGSPVVAPPTRLITIEPAESGVVYVPAYNPERIYGEPVAVYPGYVYSPPVYAQPVYASPGYSNAQIVTAGALTFGVGVVVGAALERHDWGWHAWGMNWGRPADRGNPGAGPGPGFGPGPDRPAVVYNQTTYVSRSNTVVNNNVTNNNINVNTNTYVNNRTQTQAPQAPQPQLAQSQPVMAQPQRPQPQPQLQSHPQAAMQPAVPPQRIQPVPQQVQQTHQAERAQQAHAQQIQLQAQQQQQQQQNLQHEQQAQQARQQTQQAQQAQTQSTDQRTQHQQQEQKLQNRQAAERNQQQAQLQAHAQAEAQSQAQAQAQAQAQPQAQNRQHAQAQMQQEQMHRPPAAQPHPQQQEQQRQQQQPQPQPSHPSAHQEVAQRQRAEGHQPPPPPGAHSRHDEPNR
jgi:hypothetical protein